MVLEYLIAVPSKKHTTIIFVALSILLLSSCQNQKETFAELEDWLFAFPYTSSFRPRDPMLARFGPVTVRLSEYQQWIQEQSTNEPASRLQPPQRRRLLEELIHHKLEKSVLRELGIKVEPAYMRVLDNLEYSALIAVYEKRLSITDEELRHYYHEHAKEFIQRDVKFSHLLARSISGARKFQARLKAGHAVPGMRTNIFSVLDRSHMDPHIVNLLLTLKVGQVSEPTETIDGYEVFRREAYTPASPPPFEAIKDHIRSIIAMERINSLCQKIIARTPLEINESILNDVQLTLRQDQLRK